MDARLHIGVVGAGMIGAAAAAHLAAEGHRVTVIGPSEASAMTGSGAAASHWDEARITRVIDPSRTKALAAQRSLRRHDALTQRTGIAVHEGCGVIYTSGSVADAVEHSSDLGGGARWSDRTEATERWGIALPGDDPVAWEGAPAGIVRCRALVRAHLVSARMDGAVHLDGVVNATRRAGDSWTIDTTLGDVTVDRVVVAGGPHGARMVGHELSIVAALRTRLMVEFERPMNLPSLIAGDVGHPDVKGIYWTPPVRYPDGRIMLKIGADENETRFSDDDASLVAWFRSGGHPDEARHLSEVVETLLPGAAVRSTTYEPCATTWTDNGLPYIGAVDDGVVVAVGGNGGAAKSSDEWGRLAARMVVDGTTGDDEFPDANLVPLRRGAAEDRERIVY